MSPEVIFSIVLYLVYFIGGVAGVRGAKKVGKETNVGYALSNFGYAMIALALGFIFFDLNQNILGNIPTLGFSDLFFLLAPIYLIAGVNSAVKIFSIHYSRKIIFEAAALFMVLVIGSVYFLDILKNFSTSNLNSLFDIYFVMTDITIISVVYVAFRVAGGKMVKGIASIFVGMLIAVFADVSFIFRRESGNAFLGDYSDVLYLLAGLFISIGIHLFIRSTESGEIKSFN